ncbi:Crp/Fnr family transcriptional regulator [Paenibacillus sp. N1-5-1-14]|uniref:Crp/Fnr family transcriptional regulator n=1 Tax=Paenibacillus radicibacter TaxID=2972488 RepID=UPI00215905ED|nr:Crp/Fnr family transcriptional regulator [Paenibacillus radicibacter]MCR8644019.1 Crp/Fnr family transcriptional regulator [Paenibacillus radicibacter]
MADSRMKASEIYSFIQKVPLLAGLSQAALISLSTCCYMKQVPKGKPIFTRGEPAEAVYIVMSGGVAEFVGGPNDLEIVVKVRREYDFFGELGMLIDEPQSVTAISMHASTLIVIPREQFLQLIRTESDLVQYLLKTFAMRLKISGERMIAKALLDAHAHLAYVLLWLEQEEGGHGTIAVPQEYLAQCCGLVRQTVARILGEWRREGFIQTQRGKVEVRDRTALRNVLLRNLP